MMGLFTRSFRRKRSTILYFTVLVAFLILAAYYFDVFSSNIALYSKRYIKYIKYKQSESSRTGPGEQGAGLYLQGEEAKLAESLIEKEAFNRIASDKISLERSLHDVRDSK